MIDMGAILGGRAIVGKNSHVRCRTVLECYQVANYRNLSVSIDNVLSVLTL